MHYLDKEIKGEEGGWIDDEKNKKVTDKIEEIDKKNEDDKKSPDLISIRIKKKWKNPEVLWGYL